MGLTPAEEQELASLQKSQQPQQAPTQGGRLSAAEEAELAQLQGSQGGKAPAELTNYNSLNPKNTKDMLGILDDDKQRALATGQWSQNPTINKAMAGVTSGGIGEMMAPGGEAVKTLIGRGAKGLSDFLKSGAERANVLDQVKAPESLEPFVQGKVDEATQMFNQKQISPRMLEQTSRADGQMTKINPSQIEGIHPDVDKILNDARGSQNSQPYSADSYTKPQPPDEMNLPTKDVLTIRAKLNSVTPSFDNPSLKTKQLNAGNHVRAALEQSDPNIAKISDELADAYSTRKAAVGSDNPIGDIVSNNGISGLVQKGRLASFDKQAGSNLTGLGNDIKTVNDRMRPMSLPDLFTIHGPKQLATKLSNPVTRGYDATAQAVQPGVEKLSELLNSRPAQYAEKALFQRNANKDNK